MRKILFLFMLFSLFIKCNRVREIHPVDGYYHIQNRNTDLLIDTTVNGIVFRNSGRKTTRCLPDKPAFAIISGGEEIGFHIEKVFLEDTPEFGSQAGTGEARLFDIQAKDLKGLDIIMHIRLSAHAGFPDVLISQVEIINNSDKVLVFDTLISHRYSLLAQTGDITDDQAPFWAFCGGNYEERFDWIEPMTNGFYRENSMYPAGGNPYTDVWNPEYGIGIMSLELHQESLVFPVKQEADDKVTICIKEPVNSKLIPGQHWGSTMQALLTHEGDMYNGLAVWSELLQVKGMQFQQSPESCYDPIWCGWGYENDYTTEEMLSTLPKAHEMGIKWAVVDAGWYERDTFLDICPGNWNLHPEKYPDGDASMRAFTDSVKALGMRPKLWFIPATAPFSWTEGRWDKKGARAASDEKMLLLDEAGETIDLKWLGISLLCPADSAVREANIAFVHKAMTVWGFEGFKIDGNYLNMFPPCYNPAHHHKNPLESVYAGSALLKAMYDEALSIVPDAVFEICACGTNYAIYNMQAQNQTVSSDPLSSWQVRHRGKIYHALLGSKVAYYGDHVELSDGKNDFASTIGVGGVPGTKFTLVETREMAEGSKLLTTDNEKTWKKYFSAYEKERPSEGHYLNLYDITYDYPEIHVLQKGDILYYGIFSKQKFKGKIVLKGLVPGSKYRIINYIGDNTLYPDISSETNDIDVECNTSLLIKALPVSCK